MTRKTLKIAFIGGRGVAGTYSGIETYYEEIGSRLADRGHHVTAYCRRYFTPAVATYRGIHVRRLPSLPSKHLDTLSHSVLSTLDSLWRSFDVIQYHAIGSAPLTLLPRLLGRTTLVSVRGLDWQRAKWGRGAQAFLKMGEWASARIPTATVVVSRALQQHYAAAHGREPHFIPNAVTSATPREAQRIAELGLRKDGFLLFAGRLSPEKGVHTLLEAMRPLRDRMPLVLAGGSSYSNEYIEQLRAAAWDDVRFLGSVDHDTMHELYANCYAYVLPSVMEGLSVGLLEALSFHTCIIATDIAANVEVVGDAALTFKPGDVDALRTHLLSIVDNPGLVHEYRQRAAEHAQAQPGWDDVAQQTEELYYRLLGVPTADKRAPIRRAEPGGATSPEAIRLHARRRVS
jgi:glycosyltransferase involved in cell wall biosynthesis